MLCFLGLCDWFLWCYGCLHQPQYTTCRRHLCFSEDKLLLSSLPKVLNGYSGGYRNFTYVNNWLIAAPLYQPERPTESCWTCAFKVNMEKSVPRFLIVDWAPSSVLLNGKRWIFWMGRRGASSVYRWVVSSLPHSLNPANPGWCDVIGPSEETLTHATHRTVVTEITQCYLSEWPLLPCSALMFSLCFSFHCVSKGDSWRIKFGDMTNFHLWSVYTSIHHCYGCILGFI